MNAKYPTWFLLVAVVVIVPEVARHSVVAADKGLLGGEMLGGEHGGDNEGHANDGEIEDDLNNANTSEILKGRGSRGVLGFLPGFKFGGSGGGGGLLKGLKGGRGGGGKGLLGFLGLGGKGAGGGNSGSSGSSGEKPVFPDFPQEGVGGYGGSSGNTGVGGSGGGEGGGWGWNGNNGGGSSGSSSGGGLFSSLPGAGLFKNPFGGGSLFRNPFGGGSGGKGGGRGPLRILGRLNSDQPCAAGLSSLPIISKIPFLPQSRFPSFIPSGVNTCDATCGEGGGEWRRVPPTKEEQEEMKDGTSCTYNWRDSLTGLPFLLFRCYCKLKCPPKKVRIGGIFNSQCENVSDQKTRCKCPYGQDSYKCTISILPVAVPILQRTKPYYCTCCNSQAESGKGFGGYGGGGSGRDSSVGGYSRPTAPTVSESFEARPATDIFGGYESIAESSGGYQISAASSGRYELGSSSTVSGGYAGSTSSLVGSASTSETDVREVPQGRPLGSDSLYDHL